MKFEDCKVGDIVTPKTNKIKTRDLCDVATHTALTNEFIITGLSRYTKTVDITPINPKADTEYIWVDPSCLNPVNSDKFSMSDALHGKVITRPQTPDYKLDFEVRREGNTSFRLIITASNSQPCVATPTTLTTRSSGFTFCSAARA